MPIKLFDAEVRVMDILWRMGDMPAKAISDALKEDVGWNINTTYTVIKKCVAKGAIRRSEPNFMCHPLLQREEVLEYEIGELADKLCQGSTSRLFAALLERRAVPSEVLEQLRSMITEEKKQ